MLKYFFFTKEVLAKEPENKTERPVAVSTNTPVQKAGMSF